MKIKHARQLEETLGEVEEAIAYMESLKIEVASSYNHLRKAHKKIVSLLKVYGDDTIKAILKPYHEKE